MLRQPDGADPEARWPSASALPPVRRTRGLYPADAYYTQPELLFTVSNTCFLPAPKVTSAVIHCRSRKAPPVEVCSREMLFRTVRSGFALRRKDAGELPADGLPLPKERLTEIVVACGLDPLCGERLGLAEYARLADALARRKRRGEMFRSLFDPNSEERRLRRVPDFLPVCLQDELRHCKPAVREHGEEREVIQRFRKRRLFWRLFSCIDAKGFFR